MQKLTLPIVVVAAIVTAMPLAAAKKKKKAAAPAFTYYLLTLSWAPDFCAQAGTSGDPAECGTGKKIGFVVHGLWPQGDTATGPENCKPSSTVPSSIVQQMLTYIPTASLIQHEWTTHGTCSGLTVTDYFAAVRKVRDSVKIPTQFQAPAAAQTLSPKAIEGAFSTANPSFPATAFRTSCTSGELQEERICFAKDFSPRACTKSAGECTTATTKVLPVR